MVTIITELSKYIIIILGAVYTLSCFTVFRPANVNRQKVLLRRQVSHLFVLQFFCYLVLFLKTENHNIILFYGAQALFIAMVQLAYSSIYKQSSRLITNNMCFLLSIGFIILTRLNYDQALRQFFIVIGFLVPSLAIPKLIVTLRGISRFRWVYGIGGLVLLASVFVVGATKNGATNWVAIGGFAFQPSEFVKILFVFFVASMFFRSTSFRQVCMTTGIAGLHIIILVLEKDLGGALLFTVVYLVMIYVATGNALYFFGGLTAGSFAAYVAYQLFDHVQVRVQVWSNPWPLIEGRGGQVAQSLFAIGTGGWFGLGLNGGMPYIIPVVLSDFIFSAIAEELGTIFALCLILVCISCFILFMDIAMRQKSQFYKLMALGFGVCYIFQVFLTIGGVTKFIPSTGVTLPFVSHGGSSIASSLIVFNIIQGLYIIAQKEEEQNDKKIN